MNLHPQFIGREGPEEYAVPLIGEFREIAEAPGDYQDLQDLRSAKEDENSVSSTSLADVVAQLDVSNG